MIPAINLSLSTKRKMRGKKKERVNILIKISRKIVALTKEKTQKQSYQKQQTKNSLLLLFY